jgi:hypothetical protein
MANATQEIIFQNADQTDGARPDITRDLSLDGEMNLKVYGEAKTSFLPREIAYLKFISNSSLAYTMDASYGTLRRSATNIPYEFTDDIDFVNTTEESLSFEPNEIISWEWLGRDGGVPSFAGSTVRIPEPKLAMLRVTYKVFGDRLTLFSGIAIESIAAVIQDGEVESLKVTFKEADDDDEENLEPQDYELEVIDLCSNAKVSGANVYLNGAFVGKTNNEGIIALGLLVPGQTYTIRITKTGEYIDSDLDALLNDSFTVPTT